MLEKGPRRLFFWEQSIGGSRSVFVRLETGVLGLGRGAIEMKLGWFRVDLDEGQVAQGTPWSTSLEWLLIKGRGLCHHDPLPDDNSPRVCVCESQRTARSGVRCK